MNKHLIGAHRPNTLTPGGMTRGRAKDGHSVCSPAMRQRIALATEAVLDRLSLGPRKVKQ